MKVKTDNIVSMKILYMTDCLNNNFQNLNFSNPNSINYISLSIKIISRQFLESDNTNGMERRNAMVKGLMASSNT